jgi:hypothetical protein
MALNIDLSTIKEKIRQFERKYGQTWAEFASHVETADAEDFDHWGDYIEWKGHIKMAKDPAFKIGPDYK